MHEATIPFGRKREFVESALDLFHRKGYEHTTINDIVGAMGLSKGAFYHYFESKEDVIVSMAKMFSGEAVGVIRSVLDRADLSALEKLNTAILSLNELKARERQRRSQFKSVVNSADNLKLRDSVSRSIREHTVPLFRELIEAGVEEGVFGDPINPTEMADFFVNTMHALNQAVDRLEERLYDEADPLDCHEFLLRLDEKIRFHEALLERIFDVREGIINLRTPYLVRVAKAG